MILRSLVILLFTVFFSNVSMALEPIIIVVGPPGSGKGTFSDVFKEKFGYNHISAGDLLREEIAKQTELGIQIAEVVSKGEPIKADVMRSLMAQQIQHLVETNKPFIIDGFGGQDSGDLPFLYKTLSNYHLLDRTIAIFFDAADSVCQQRMSGRLVCSQCAQIYNLNSLPPQRAGICDLCEGSLIQRTQDNPETIAKRLHGYHERMEPNYQQASTLFPTLHYRTDGDLNRCHEFFLDLGEEISHFDGNTTDFLSRFDSTCHIN